MSNSEPITSFPTIVFSEIVLQQFIGQGGFGKVYRALDRRDGSTVAVKALKKGFWQNPPAISGLLREAAVLSRLSHPGIMGYHGWGRFPHQGIFLVLDWIDGPSAGDWIQAEQPTISAILSCGTQVGAALMAAHTAGIVHGDVSPTNVLKTSSGAFILTDFGFATLASHVSRTRGGTLGYLAPEQLSSAFGPLTEQTDVYGLGGLLYALLTGRPPTTGSHPTAIEAQTLSLKSPDPVTFFRDDLPAGLNALVLRCLNKEPGARPLSVSEVVSGLQKMMKEFGDLPEP